MTAVSILSSNVGILQNEKRLIELLSPSGAAYKGFYLVQSFFFIFLWVMLASLLSCYLSPRPNLQTTMSVNNVRLRSRLQSLMTLTIWSKNLPPNKKEKGHGRHHVPFTGFLSCMFVSHLLLKYLMLKLQAKHYIENHCIVQSNYVKVTNKLAESSFIVSYDTLSR